MSNHAAPDGHHREMALSLTGIEVPPDAPSYNDWVRSVHEMLPSVEGDADAPFESVEREVLEALHPTLAGHPLCSAAGSGNRDVLAGARLARTLAAAARELSPSSVSAGERTRIYDGADGEGTVWAVGVRQGGPSRRLVFELYAPLESLACADQKELVALWALGVQNRRRDAPTKGAARVGQYRRRRLGL